MKGKLTSAAFSILEALIALAIITLCLSGVGMLLLENGQNILAAQSRNRDLWLASDALQAGSSTVNSIVLDTYTKQLTSIAGNVSLSRLDVNWSAALQDRTCQIGQVDWSGATMVNMPYSFGPISSLSVNGQEMIATLSSTAIKTDPSLLVFSLASSTNPMLLGSLDNATSTVAGINGVAVFGNYAYVASARAISSSQSFGQLQVIDVSSPSTPKLISTYKLPGVSGTSGQGIGNSIAYREGYVYLGLTKTGSGPEFNVVDVHDPAHPQLAGSFSLGNTINAIVVKDGYAYVAHPADVSSAYNEQLTILDVSNPSNIIRVNGFRAADEQGNGKSLWLNGYQLFLGRTVTNTANLELQVLDTSISGATTTLIGGQKINGSVNSLMVYSQKLFLITNSQLGIFDITDSAHITELESITLPNGAAGTSLICSGKTIYAGSATSNKGFISIVTSVNDNAP